MCSLVGFMYLTPEIKHNFERALLRTNNADPRLVAFKRVKMGPIW